jgi:hypothetical protein
LSGSGLIGEISGESMIEVVEEKVNGTTTTGWRSEDRTLLQVV